MSDPLSLVLALGSRLLDKKKPLGKTNVATGGAVGLAGAATYLVQSGEPTMVAVGGFLYLAGALLALYKEKEKS